VVGVGIVASASVILDGDRLDIHGEWSGSEVDVSTSPVTCTLGGGVRSSSGVEASNPVTHLYAHGSLGEVLSVQGESITIVEGSNEISSNVPLDVILGPVDGVGDEVLDGRADWVVDSTVVGSCVSLSEEVTLDGGIGRPKPFPINLIQIVRLQNETADGSGASARSHCHIDLSEHDVLGTADGWGIGLLADHELGTVGSI
jgi:hypothetical protein